MRGFVNNNFVQASPSGTGLVGKIFGGIADTKRAKTMMDLQMEQHRQREAITTGEIGNRAALQAAAKDWTSKQETERHFDYTKQHHELAQQYGLQLSGYKGVAYQRMGNLNRPKSEGDVRKPGKGRAPSYADTVAAVKEKKIKPVEAASLNKKYSQLHGEKPPKVNKTKKNSGVTGGNA